MSRKYKQIERAVTKANGNRRTRLLNMHDVMYAISQVESSSRKRCDCQVGGMVNYTTYEAYTTYMIVFKITSRVYGVYVDVGTARGSHISNIVQRLYNSKTVDKTLRELATSPDVITFDRVALRDYHNSLNMSGSRLATHHLHNPDNVRLDILKTLNVIEDGRLLWRIKTGIYNLEVNVSYDPPPYGYRYCYDRFSVGKNQRVMINDKHELLAGTYAIWQHYNGDFWIHTDSDFKGETR